MMRELTEYRAMRVTEPSVIPLDDFFQYMELYADGKPFDYEPTFVPDGCNEIPEETLDFLVPWFIKAGDGLNSLYDREVENMGRNLRAFGIINKLPKAIVDEQLIKTTIVSLQNKGAKATLGYDNRLGSKFCEFRWRTVYTRLIQFTNADGFTDYRIHYKANGREYDYEVPADVSDFMNLRCLSGVPVHIRAICVFTARMFWRDKIA